MKVTLRIGDEVRSARVVRRGQLLVVAMDDGRMVELRLLAAGDGGFELERGQARLHGAGTTVDAVARQIWVNGRTFAYRREPPAGGAREVPAETSLSSAIPAVVVEVLVRPGERVAAGQKLLLLESMKMVLPIQASQAGTVHAILCAPGDAVQPGAALVELEPDR
jgi:biotin carboxyl carrier protein